MTYESDAYFGSTARIYCAPSYLAQEIVNEDPTVLNGNPVEIVQKLLAALKRRAPTIGREDQIVKLDRDGARWISRNPTEALLPASLGQSAVTAYNTALAAIDASTGALAANHLVDSMVKSPASGGGISIAKLNAGTNIFTDDVILSRGTNKPVVVLGNSAFTMFSAGNSGAVGLRGVYKNVGA